MGMHRVVWPNPQSRGDNNTKGFLLTLLKLDAGDNGDTNLFVK
jgi:hypothetical protein